MPRPGRSMIRGLFNIYSALKNASGQNKFQKTPENFREDQKRYVEFQPEALSKSSGMMPLDLELVVYTVSNSL